LEYFLVIKYGNATFTTHADGLAVENGDFPLLGLSNSKDLTRSQASVQFTKGSNCE
jgi:hypothetical protein